MIVFIYLELKAFLNTKKTIQKDDILSFQTWNSIPVESPKMKKENRYCLLLTKFYFAHIVHYIQSIDMCLSQCVYTDNKSIIMVNNKHFGSIA